MGTRYYISSHPSTDGTHVIHREGCPFLSGNGRHILLGDYSTVQAAVDAGKSYYEETGICIFCLKRQFYLDKSIMWVSAPEVVEHHSEIKRDDSPENFLFCCIS